MKQFIKGHSGSPARDVAFCGMHAACRAILPIKKRWLPGSTDLTRDPARQTRLESTTGEVEGASADEEDCLPHQTSFAFAQSSRTPHSALRTQQ